MNTIYELLISEQNTNIQLGLILLQNQDTLNDYVKWIIETQCDLHPCNTTYLSFLHLYITPAYRLYAKLTKTISTNLIDGNIHNTAILSLSHIAYSQTSFNADIAFFKQNVQTLYISDNRTDVITITDIIEILKILNPYLTEIISNITKQLL